MKKFLTLTFGLFFLSATLCAHERVPVGERKEPTEQKVELQENEDQIRQESEEQTQPDKAGLVAAKSMFGTCFGCYSTHPGAWQSFNSISPSGTTIELSDGSIWVVNPSDWYLMMDWMYGDTLIITPNHSWFSYYDYCITNQNTNESVRVNLSLGPYYNGPKTHWITRIDYYQRLVILEDGSMWRIASYDEDILSSWLENDTVIIGINDGWLRGDKANILINVSTVNHVAGRCF